MIDQTWDRLSRYSEKTLTYSKRVTASTSNDMWRLGADQRVPPSREWHWGVPMAPTRAGTKETATIWWCARLLKRVHQTVVPTRNSRQHDPDYKARVPTTTQHHPKGCQEIRSGVTWHPPRHRVRQGVCVLDGGPEMRITENGCDTQGTNIWVRKWMEGKNARPDDGL